VRRKSESGKPRYEPDECRQLRLTYGRPFKVWLRLTKEQPVEEEVYLGDMPIMLGGGEFIINGAERVVVSQLHRSPGVDFVSEIETGDRKVFSCRVIPERGSWIGFNTASAINDRASTKAASQTTLPARWIGKLNAEILRIFYESTVEKVVDTAASQDRARSPSTTWSIRLAANGPAKSSSSAARRSARTRPRHLHFRREWSSHGPAGACFNALADDNTASHEEALLRIYQRLRPGNPPQLEKARALFHEKFFDTNRYRWAGSAGFASIAS
jgi:DNA-directed RNA polymerase subunit beta